MKVVCAYCKKDMGTKPGPDNAISHGICEKCVKIVNKEIDKIKTVRKGE